MFIALNSSNIYRAVSAIVLCRLEFQFPALLFIISSLPIIAAGQFFQLSNFVNDYLTSLVWGQERRQLHAVSLT